MSKKQDQGDDKPSAATGAGWTTTSHLPVDHDNAVETKVDHASVRLLQPPITGPVRPLSPDTVSNLSIEEYDHLNAETFTSRGLNEVHDNDLSIKGTSSAGHSLRAFWKRNKGLGYMIAAQVFGSLMNVTTRLLEIEGNNGKGMHPLQILFARMAITMILASAYMWYVKTPDFPFGKPEVRWLLMARGFGGFFGVFGMYYSLVYLPLADATVITFLAPSLACYACSLLINEPFTRREQIAAYISLFGVILIARPTALFSFKGGAQDPSSSKAISSNATAPNHFENHDASDYDSVTPLQRLAAVGVALLGVLGAATAYTTIRWIGKRAHPLLSVNYFATWCTFVSVVGQLAVPGVGFLLPANIKDWTYLIFLGTCGFIMVSLSCRNDYNSADILQQFLLAAGLSYERSSRGTNMTYTQMLSALAFDKLIFNHTPSWVSLIGSSLILLSAIWVAIQKDTAKIKHVAENHATRSDEESQTGLITGIVSDAHASDQTEAAPVQEIQLRALR